MKKIFTFILLLLSHFPLSYAANTTLDYEESVSPNSFFLTQIENLRIGSPSSRDHGRLFSRNPMLANDAPSESSSEEEPDLPLFVTRNLNNNCTKPIQKDSLCMNTKPKKYVSTPKAKALPNFEKKARPTLRRASSSKENEYPELPWNPGNKRKSFN